MTKVIIHLLVVFSLAIGFAFGGWALYSEGTKELAKINAELGYELTPGPRLAIYRETDASDIVFVTCLFADLPTGTTAYFSAPTIGFGQFLMSASVVLLALDIWWLRRRHLTGRSNEPPTRCAFDSHGEFEHQQCVSPPRPGGR